MVQGTNKKKTITDFLKKQSHTAVTLAQKHVIQTKTVMQPQKYKLYKPEQKADPLSKCSYVDLCDIY